MYAKAPTQQHNWLLCVACIHTSFQDSGVPLFSLNTILKSHYRSCVLEEHTHAIYKKKVQVHLFIYLHDKHYMWNWRGVHETTMKWYRIDRSNSMKMRSEIQTRWRTYMLLGSNGVVMLKMITWQLNVIKHTRWFVQKKCYHVCHF